MARKEKEKMQGIRYSDKYLKKSMAEHKELSATPYVRYNARVELSRKTMQEATKLSRQISHDTLRNIMELIDRI